MNAPTQTIVLTALAIASACATAQAPDPRLREVVYDPGAVVTVPVKRGVVTLVVLASDEAIVEVAAGLGADCSRADAVWCVAAQAGGRTLFVKPKSGASEANTVAVVTDRRSHAFRFVVLAESDPRPPVYRLTVKDPPASPTAARSKSQAHAEPSSLEILPIDRLPTATTEDAARSAGEQLDPIVSNASYSLAEGANSADIVPVLVFDDGRFTYLRFPGNREIPAVFHVLGDGSETLVNARMQGDLLVVDRVSRRLVLRAGSAVVGLWNDAFDSEGRPPIHGTTVPGLQRVLKATQGALPAGEGSR